MTVRFAVFATFLGLALLARPCAAGAVEYDQDPIAYSTAPVDDAISRLEQRMARNEARLAYDESHGFLPSVLQALNVPISSQVLVFSKTSLQRERISPATPRALYFNDEIYVGWVPGGEVLEVAAVDARLGTIFYVMKQQDTGKPTFQRAHECVQCHDSRAMTGGVPGLMMRSVFPDRTGQPVFTAGTFVTDQTSPVDERWGGWYVTGKYGSSRHMGNAIADSQGNTVTLDREAGANNTALSKRVDATMYLGGGNSDLVALLVLGHQTQMHNLITQASYSTRLALRDEAAINGALGLPRTNRRESTVSRIRSAGEPLLRYLLFSGEAPLGQGATGTSAFARDYVARGRRDGRGRSLRDLDLRRRLFRYPCSPLIYTQAFDELPGEMKEYLYRRLWEILNGRETEKDYAHLSRADRQAIAEILMATKSGLPAYWTPAGYARE